MSYSWFKSLDDHTKNLCGIEFCLKKSFRFRSGWYFYGNYFVEATKFLDYIVANYSQWHTERAPISKKVNSVEEISMLSVKLEALMKLVANKSAPIDLNDVPLSTLIEQNSDLVDVNFVSRNNFNNTAYRNDFNPRTYPGSSSNNL